MDKSILKTIKKLLGIAEEYDVFDQDIIIHINSVFSILNQMGVGPEAAFYIEDDEATWGDFMSEDPSVMASVKSYVYVRVRLQFDPPTTSFAIDALQKLETELGWRLNVHAEGVKYG